MTICSKCHGTGYSEEEINHPNHYISHPSGIECIELAERLDFCPGNALKYVWRFKEKGGETDLRKALWYISNELALREHSGDRLTIASKLATFMAHESDPRLALIAWYICVGDQYEDDQGIKCLRLAKNSIEDIIHGFDNPSR